MRRIFKKIHKQSPKFTIGAIALHGSKEQISRIWRLLPTASLLVLFLLTLAIQSFSPFVSLKSYELSNQVRGLTGDSREDTSEYLKLSEDGSNYSFEVPETTEANSEHTGRIADAYSTNLSTNAKDGITLTEKNSKIAVTLIPDFHTQAGQKVEGDHLVYPSGPDKLVYTLKYNGLKEDIIVPEYRKDELSYKFTLRLPAGVEAKLDDQGNIGIYSSDSSLFGDISYGSDEDRAKVENARQNGEKTNLVMTIPYPIIKDAKGIEHTDRASFILGDRQTNKTETGPDPSLPPEVAEQAKQMATSNDYQLSLNANNLKDLSYPIAIDPTMQVTSAGDFKAVSLEDGTEVDTTNNLIQRSSLSGAELNSWALDDTPTTNVGHGMAFHAYNGFVYTHNQEGGNMNYAPINETTGDIGVFSSTVAPGTGTSGGSIIYNGYFYSLGDEDNSAGVGGTDVRFAKINKDGTMGSFASTSNFANARYRMGVSAYNGYMYISGGAYDTGCPLTCSENTRADVQYAKIRADGSVGSWASAGSNFTNARRGHRNVTYNNKLYIIGGSGGVTNVPYAQINSDGTLGAWQAATSLVDSRNGPMAVAYKGYMYVTAAGPGYVGTSYYAQINADGSLGAWRQTTSLPVTRQGVGYTIYNGRFYVAGGYNGSDYSTIHSTTIKPAGELSAFAGGTSMSANPPKHTGSAAGQGFLYNTGGCTDGNPTWGSCTSPDNTVRFAVINSDGTLSWSTTGVLPAARHGHKALVHNGYLYVMGGCTGVGVCNARTDMIYAPINESTGAIGGWTTATGTIVQSHNFAVVGRQDKIYVLGGATNNGGSPTASVRSYAVQSNGGLNAHATETSLPNTQFRMSAAISGDRLYFNNASSLISINILTNGSLGGSWSTAYASVPVTTLSVMTAYSGYLYLSAGNQVHTAKTNTDGTISAWRAQGNLATARTETGIEAYNGRLFIFAGCENQNDFGTGACGATGAATEIATINNGGSGNVDSWTAGTNMNTSRRRAGAVAHNGYLYALGGNNGSLNSSVTNSAEFAPINSNGSLGAWTTTASFGTARYLPKVIVYNQWLYIMGGRDSGGTDLDDIQFANINPTTGALSGWTDVTGSDDLPGSTHFGASINRYKDKLVYLINNGSFYASIQSNGQVSSWTSTTIKNQTVFNVFVTAINQNFIYTIGSGGVDSTVVEYAQINEDGSLGAWSYTTPTPQLSVNNLSNGLAYVTNGYVYIYENYNGEDFGLKGSFLPGGGIGKWEVMPDVTHAYNTQWSWAMDKGRLYVLGGGTGANVATSYSSAIQSISRTGSFTRRYDFETGVRPTKLITRGTQQPGSSIDASYADSTACGATLYDAAVNNLGIGYDGSSALSIDIGATQTLARCLLLRYSINDTQSSVFPDSGNESTITDFDLYFDPNPGKRLRGGRSFITGQDRGLDAAP